MTHKPNGIVQLFQMTKNKFNITKLVKGVLNSNFRPFSFELKKN